MATPGETPPEDSGSFPVAATAGEAQPIPLEGGQEGTQPTLANMMSMLQRLADRVETISTEQAKMQEVAQATTAATAEIRRLDEYTVAQVVRRSLLKPDFADYGSEAVAQLSDELLRREAEYSVTAAAKAAVQQRFGVGPDPNEEEDNDDEPPSRARRRRPSGRRPRPDFRPTADDADKGKGKA
eukprot:jgi/Tetstr1/440907/TSEL_029178.t1